MTDKIEQQVEKLYQLAKENPDDANFQAAVQIVKTLRRSRGSLQGWNDRYRVNIESLNDQIKIQESEIESLQSYLHNINKEVNHLIEQKRLATIKLDKTSAELRNIQREAELAGLRVKESHSWYGKFTIIWNFMHSVFSDIPSEIDSNGILDNSKAPEISNDLDDLNSKAWMKTDTASIQRDSLDR